MKVNLKQKHPVQSALLVKYIQFWNATGGSKQLDHALSGLADSDPLHCNQEGQETRGSFSKSTHGWTEVCSFKTHLELAGSPR